MRRLLYGLVHFIYEIDGRSRPIGFVFFQILMKENGYKKSLL